MVMVSLPLAVCRLPHVDCLLLAAWHLQSGIGSRLAVCFILGRALAADRQERRQSPDQPHSCLFCARRGCMRWATLIAPAMAPGSGGRERTRRRALVGRLLMLGRCLTFCRLELGVCSHSKFVVWKRAVCVWQLVSQRFVVLAVSLALAVSSWQQVDRLVVSWRCLLVDG